MTYKFRIRANNSYIYLLLCKCLMETFLDNCCSYFPGTIKAYIMWRLRKSENSWGTVLDKNSLLHVLWILHFQLLSNHNWPSKLNKPDLFHQPISCKTVWKWVEWWQPERFKRFQSSFAFKSTLLIKLWDASPCLFSKLFEWLCNFKNCVLE